MDAKEAAKESANKMANLALEMTGLGAHANEMNNGSQPSETQTAPKQVIESNPVESQQAQPVMSMPTGAEPIVRHEPRYDADEALDRVGVKVIEGMVDAGLHLITKLISKI